MATKTFEELKQLAIQIRDEKTNKQNTATRVGTAMLEHINKLEQDYYDKTNIDEQSKNTTQSINNLNTKIDKRTTEYNVSVNHPTSGTDGTNRYDLAGAIAQVPAELRTSGLTVSFLNESGDTEKWEFGGDSWAAGGFSQVGAVKLTELESNIGISFSKEVSYNEKGNTIIISSGEFMGFGGGTSTDYIEVGEMKSISIHNLITETDSAVAVAFYDESKSFISAIPYPTTNKLLSPILAIFPSNCKYFAVSKQSSSSSDSIKIYTNINASDIEPIRTKADIGSVFGAQKVEADGTSNQVIFTNFKSGLTVYSTLKCAVNSYWYLYGLVNGKWVKIQDLPIGYNLSSFILPEEVDDYESIKIQTNGGTITGQAYTITELDLEQIIKKIENASSIDSVRTKADIGSVFGAQKVEADGSDTKLIFNNVFKEGDIIHLVNVKAAVNTYWGLKGFRNGVWTIISSRLFAGQTIPQKDVIIPDNTEQYEKIAIETEGSLILSGYGYTITDLDLQDIEKIKDLATYTDELKELPIIQQNVLLPSDNLINPAKVELIGGGWWVSDYIQVNEGETYYSNASLGFFTYNESKADVTSTSPFVSGSPIPSGVSFVRAKIGASGNTPDTETATKKANDLWLSKNNEASKYAKMFNTYLINVVDSDSRDMLAKLMPHAGKGLFCVGDSYTMQGAYFQALLAVTGLNKIGDTRGDGNGQPYTLFAKNIIKYKEQILQCKFVTILGGTNDYGHGGENLGTINDCIKDEYSELKVPILKLNEEGYYVKDDSIDTTYKVLTEEDINSGQTPKSVYAAIMTCVNIIHSWDKTITVVLCSQPERLSYGSQSCDPPLLRNGMNMNLLAKAMREIHEMFGVPYYDFHSNGWTINQVEVYMNDGTLHPNALGGEKIGRGLGMYINSL